MQDQVEITVHALFPASTPTFSNIWLQTFSKTYLHHLERAVAELPASYSYRFAEVPAVHARMMAAVIKRAFNKDSIAFKRTCKELNIPYTYAGIKNYLEKGKTSDAPAEAQ